MRKLAARISAPRLGPAICEVYSPPGQPSAAIGKITAPKRLVNGPRSRRSAVVCVLLPRNPMRNANRRCQLTRHDRMRSERSHQAARTNSAILRGTRNARRRSDERASGGADSLAKSLAEEAAHASIRGDVGSCERRPPDARSAPDCGPPVRRRAGPRRRGCDRGARAPDTGAGAVGSKWRVRASASRQDGAARDGRAGRG